MQRIGRVLLIDGGYLALAIGFAIVGLVLPVPFLSLFMLSSGVVLAVTSLVAAVLDGVDGWRDKELQREQARARLPRYVPLQPTRVQLPPGEETPTPHFLDKLFDYLVQNKTDKVPSVRELAALSGIAPGQIQAMLAHLAAIGAIVDRTERGASGRLVWNMVQCRERMIIERPDYAPRITPEGKVENV